MMKSRTREHQGVQQSDGDAYFNSLAQRAQHPTCLRTMNQEFVVDPSITGGNYEWLAVGSEPDMTNESFVKDCIDYVAFMAPPFG